MRHSYTMKEKVDRLNGLLPETAHEMGEEIRDGYVLCDNIAGRVAIRFDFRSALRQKMEEQGISQYAMAKRLGMAYQNFHRFIMGKIPIPLAKVEELMWLMMDDNMIIDLDDEQVTDIRSRRGRKA